jgi:hypothetical protein
MKSAPPFFALTTAARAGAAPVASMTVASVKMSDA